MKINCDIGEGVVADMPDALSIDEKLIPYIDMANIACGFHASSPELMAQTIALAVEHDVLIGAHPSYHDREGFGRRDMTLTAAEIKHLMLYQVGALQALCVAQQTEVSYIKPHGALYNAMMRDSSILLAILAAIASMPDPLPLMVLANSQSAKIQALADDHGVPLLFEAFCDRAYMDEGDLVSRTHPQAVLYSDTEIQQRLEGLLSHQQVTSINGKVMAIRADTICVHGDNPQALQVIKTVHRMISEHKASE